MSVNTAVINFGSPRSGTTVMRRILGALPDCFVTKLPEQAANHPCTLGQGTPESARNGLLWLSRWLEKEQVVFVRTVRHPIEIAESFAATRTMPEKTPGLAKNSDEQVVEWIRSESENVAHQRERLLDLRPGRDHHFIEVRYESLHGRGGQESFAKSVASVTGHKGKLMTRFKEVWNRVHVRPGRLSEGIDEVLDDEARAWFREQLDETIHRGGYR